MTDLDTLDTAPGHTRSTPPGADWMRPPGATRAVVVQSRSFADAKRHSLELAFPGYHILTPGCSTTGQGYDAIFMLWRPETTRDRTWILESVTTRLRDPKTMKLWWLV